MRLEEIFNIPQHITKPEYTQLRMLENGGYYWLQGETIKLTWDVTGDVKNELGQTYLTASNFMKDKDVKVKMYNFMGKKVREWFLKRPGTVIEVKIDNDPLKNDYFARDLRTGTYQISVTIYSNIGMVLELVNRTDCEIEVR